MGEWPQVELVRQEGADLQTPWVPEPGENDLTGYEVEDYVPKSRLDSLIKGLEELRDLLLEEAGDAPLVTHSAIEQADTDADRLSKLIEEAAMDSRLKDFVAESNRIEGIHRVTEYEILAHKEFLELPEVRVPELEHFVREVAARPLRDKPGMNVRVGPHVPPPGGPGVRDELGEILIAANEPGLDCTPWGIHVEYEKLHPFMDGNGRSGRALWAWMRLREGRDPFALGFLHSFYYETLNEARDPEPFEGEGQ